jgi:aminotransferase EvaB
MIFAAKLSRLLRKLNSGHGSKFPGCEQWTRRWHSRPPAAYEVAFVDYSARFRFAQEELLRELERTFGLRTDAEISDYLETFASDYARALGLAHGVGTSSGTTALTFALQALGLKPGDEVLVPSYTYVASGLAVCNAGGKPVFVDASTKGPHIDVAQLARKLGPRTRVVMTAHLFGGMADPAPLLAFCRAQGLSLLEDACQAHGLQWHGRSAGSFGDAAAFSFNQTKLISGLGNGGMFATSSGELSALARHMRDPESPAPWCVQSRRTPGYLDPVPVACLRAQITALDRILAHQVRLADGYSRGLAGLPIILPQPEAPGAHTWYWYVIGTSRRDDLRAFLARRGIDTRAGFFEPLPRLSGFRGLSDSVGPFPTAEKLWRESLALPIGTHLDLPDVHRVVEAVRAFFG